MSKTDLTTPEFAPRERILAAAHDLFYGEGIRATGVDKIIDKAKVTKVTFYRQFESKDQLIRAYFDYRHERWMAWLRLSLASNIELGMRPKAALLATLESWFKREDFRGCAFLNATSEIGSTAPDVMAAVRAHKAEMSAVFERLLLSSKDRARQANAMAIAVDGAILHAQMGMPLASVLAGLEAVLQSCFE